MKMMKGLMENKKVHEEKIEFFNSLGVAESFLTIKSSKNPKAIKKNQEIWLCKPISKPPNTVKHTTSKVKRLIGESVILIYEELLEIHEKNNSPIEKQAKDMNSQFAKKKTQMAP